MTDKFEVSRPSTVGPSKKTYYKRNFVKALEIITPGVYLEEDIALSSLAVDPISKLVNSHIGIANNLSSLDLGISAIEEGDYGHLSSIDGISTYFIKQNGLTNVTPYNFEKYILKPLGLRFHHFDTSTSFKTFVDDTLLPSIQLNTPTATEYASDTSGTHEYLIKNLSWLYFLNTSAIPARHFEPSEVVSDLLVKNIYTGNAVVLEDAMQGLTEYLWKNYETCTTFPALDVIPTDYLSGTATYTSGTQQLDKLKTLTAALYSNAPTDAQDLFVKESFENFIDAATLL